MSKNAKKDKKSTVPSEKPEETRMKKASAEKIVMLPVSEVRPYEKNPRKNKDAVQYVKASIEKFGFKQPIIIDGNRVIVCGHTRLLAAKSLGMAEVPCIFADDLTDEQVKAYRLADNKVAEFAEWDSDLLNIELGDLADLDIDMTQFGFDPFEEEQPEIVEDEIPEEVEPVAKLGDIFQLGDHRLMCGDSTDTDAVEKMLGGVKARMVFTDPPWNVAYGTNVEKGNVQGYKVRTILNDSMTTEQFHDFMDSIFASMKNAIEPGCPTYVVMSAQEWGNLMLSLKENGFHWSSTIIWAKDTLVLSRKDYHTQYEPIWYGWEDSASRLKNVKDRKQSDLWQIPRPKKSDLHPTTKPVELVARAIKNSSDKGEVVLDLFGGSGTTLIAAEQTGRKARLMELDPKYCDVIIARWEKLTGGKAELVQSFKTTEHDRTRHNATTK